MEENYNQLFSNLPDLYKKINEIKTVQQMRSLFCAYIKFKEKENDDLNKK